MINGICSRSKSFDISFPKFIRLVVYILPSYSKLNLSMKFVKSFNLCSLISSISLCIFLSAAVRFWVSCLQIDFFLKIHFGATTWNLDSIDFNQVIRVIFKGECPLQKLRIRFIEMNVLLHCLPAQLTPTWDRKYHG